MKLVIASVISLLSFSALAAPEGTLSALKLSREITEAITNFIIVTLLGK